MMVNSMSFEVTARRIRGFGMASGDSNPLHFDDDYAERTRFKGRIAHGMLTASFVSAAIAQVYGSDSQVVILLDEAFSYLLPVRIGDTITVNLAVDHTLRGKGRLLVSCTNQKGKQVLRGNVGIMIESLGDANVA